MVALMVVVAAVEVAVVIDVVMVVAVDVVVAHGVTVYVVRVVMDEVGAGGVQGRRRRLGSRATTPRCL